MDTAAFDSVIGPLPEPTALVSADGRIDAVNRAFTRAFGWPVAAVRGRPLAELVANPDLEEYLRHCRMSSELLFGGFTVRHANGAEVSCRTEGAAVSGNDHIAPGRQVLLRMILKQPAIERFTALTRKIGDLSAEVARRRKAEEVAATAAEAERRLRERLVALTEASETLVTSLATDDVLSAIGRLLTGLIPADAYAVWQGDRATGIWQIVWQRGLSAAFGTTVTASSGFGNAAVSISEPLFVADIDELALLADRRSIYEAESIRSLLIIPLRVHGTSYGTAVAYYRHAMTVADEDRHVASAFCNLASAALTMATLYDAESRSRAAAERAEHRADFLARASAALSSSLDYERTLKTVAELAVPEIADWCAVDIADERGALKRLAVAHPDPSRLTIASELQARYPSDPRSPYGPAEAMRTARPIILTDIPDELLAAGVRDAEHLRLLHSLALTSYMCVPLVAHGRPLGVITLLSAESRRRYSEADLRFAEEVAWRAALAVENARAYQEARQANRIKDEFLATLSHELRTPLNAVLGYARMLRSGMLAGEKSPRALEVIERNATALNQIVEDVLDVSRIVAGKIRLNVQPIDPAAVLRDAIATVTPAADAKGVRLDVVLDPRAGPVSGDPDRLQQIVWNLLSNAVKFTPRGGRVQLRLERSNSHVQIVVSDTGAGIKPEFLPHLFERFRQADSGFARERGGLGLGLALSRQLVEMHGGTITGASDGEGQGATFVVRLPIMIASGTWRAEAESQAPQPLPSAPPLSALTGVRVLAVDDDPDALLLLSEILAATGADVLTAPSAAAALERLAIEPPPHVIVSDIGMPGLDGFEFIRRVRQSSQPDVRALPAVALTAYARSEDRTQALESGYQTHLAKPISPQELSAAIRALTQGA